jgi:hypothetical protein
MRQAMHLVACRTQQYLQVPRAFGGQIRKLRKNLPALE